MALSSRLRTTRTISGVDSSTTGDGSPISPRRSMPLADAAMAAPATASPTSSSRATDSMSSDSVPDWMRDSSNRSFTRPARRSISRRIVA